MAIVAKRQQEATRLIDDAAQARQAAIAARAEAEQERADVAAEREKLIAQARLAAQLERENMLAQAAQQIGKLRDEAASAVVRSQAAAEAAVVDHAGTLAVDVARRLLDRFRQQDLLATFIDECCGDLRGLSKEVQQSLAAGATAEHPIDVISAIPLSDGEQQQIGATLTEIFGREVPVAYRSDPQLINGLELHGQNTIIRNSWRADLDRIRKEISQMGLNP